MPRQSASSLQRVLCESAIGLGCGIVARVATPLARWVASFDRPLCWCIICLESLMEVHFTTVKRSPFRLWLRHYDEELTWYVDFTADELEFARKAGLHRWNYFVIY